ncbi:MAG TPA: hypothetical protein VJ021_07145 [Thermoplasmata archaeon]|nr:hypothetical protein [Thermoplasmata archaeon]
MNRKEFERILAKARTDDERLTWFGALLTLESKLEGQLIIVGGSAVEIYLTSNEYVSMDIDVVGNKAAISTVLRRWGFDSEKGRDQRVYWVKSGLGNVDLVGPTDRSGLPPRAFTTPYGDVLLGPVEHLIVRRLMMARRKRSREMYRQAAMLATRYKRGLDWDYIRAQAAYEKVLPLFEELREQVAARPPPRK